MRHLAHILLFALLVSVVISAPPPPDVALRTPLAGSWAGCDFQQIRFRLLDLEGIDETTIKLRINGVLYTWPDATHLYWDGDSILRFTPSVPFTNGSEVRVVFLEVADRDGTPIPDSLAWSFFIDSDKPFIVPSSRIPAPDTIVTDRRPTVSIEVKDTTSGIPLSGLCLCFDSRGYSCPTNRNSGYCWEGTEHIEYDGNVFTINTAGLGMAFQNEDSVTVRLRKAVDRVPQDTRVCGPNWVDTLDTNLDWSFVVDIVGPRSTLLFPDVGDTIACDTLVILLEDFTGVDVPTCRLRLGTALAMEGFSPYVTGYGDTVIYSGTGTAEFFGEGAITAYVNSVRDLVGNQSTWIAGDHPTWSFTVDKSPPASSAPSPADGGVSSSASPIISVALDDAIAGVDAGSIVFTVDETAFPMASPAVSWDGSRATFNSATAGLSWSDCDTVEVCVTAADRVRPDRCGPNVMSPFCWDFIVDQGGPIVEIVRPRDGVWTACALQEIKIYIHDPSGVDIATLLLSVDGVVYSGLDHSTYASDTLRFTPTVPFIDMSTVEVIVLDVQDSIGNGLDSPVATEFRIDLSPPSITSIDPSPESIIGAGTSLSIGVIDYGIGFRPEGSVVSVEGADFAWPGGFSYGGGLLTFDLSLAGAFEDGDTIEICAHLEDAMTPPYCGPNSIDSCFHLVFDGIGPTAELVYPPDSAVTACDDGAIKILVLDNYVIDFATLELEVAGTLYGHTSAEIAIVGDTVIFLPPEPFAHFDTVEIVLNELRDLAGNSLEDAPLSWEFYIDTEPPEIIDISPPAGIITTTMDEVSVLVRDIPSGIDESFFAVSVNGTAFGWPHPAMHWDGVSLNFALETAGITSDDGDTLRFCIDGLADNIPPELCGPNIADGDTCWDYFFYLTGPTATLVSPAPGAISSCPSLYFVIRIEAISGVDEASIEVAFDGDVFTLSDDELDWSPPLLTFSPPGDFSHGETVACTLVSADDIAGNPLSAQVSAHYIVDIRPPVVGSPTPEPDITVADAIHPISLVATDFPAGVLRESAVLSVNGIDYAFPAPALSWAGDELVFDPETAGIVFADGETVFVCLEQLTDDVDTCNNNAISAPFCWEFFVSLTGPTARIRRPQRWTWTACGPDEQSIVMSIRDDDGVDPASIGIRVQGVDYTVADPELSFVDTILTFIPSAPWADAETVRVRLFSAEDSLGNSMPSPISWEFYVDRSPPFAHSPSPSDGAIVGELPYVQVRLNDAGSGVADTSIVLTMDGVPFTTRSGLFRIGDIVALFEDSYFEAPSGDVEFCVETAWDKPAYCAPNQMTEPYCWTIHVADEKPEAHPICPEDGDFVACPEGEQIVAIYLSAAFGIVSDSIELIIDGDFVDFSSGLLELSDTILTYSPPTPWLDGDTITVELLSAPDSFGNPVDPIAYSFVVDLSPPEIYSIEPPPGEMISPAEVFYFGIRDVLSGVDSSSIFVAVEGEELRAGEPGGPVWFSGDSLLVLNLSSMGYIPIHDTVEVCVSAKDSPDWCTPNELLECFLYPLDDEGPRLILESPSGGTCSSCSLQGFRGLLSDASLIDDTTITFRVNGEIFKLADPEVVFSAIDRRVYFTPTDPWNDGDTMRVDSFYVADIHGNWGEDLLDLTVYIDLSPPAVTPVSPPDGGVATRPTPIISFIVADSGCGGVNPATIRFTVDGVLLSLDSSGVYYSPDTVRFVSGEHGLIWDDGDTVEVCVVGAGDRALYCGPNFIPAPICWTFTLNTSGPTATINTPEREQWIACDSAEQVIRIFLADSDGLNLSSVKLYVKGVLYTIDSPELTYNTTSSSLVFRPSAPWNDGDTVRVLLAEAEDVFGNGLPEPLDYSFFVDLSPPEVISVSPPVGIAIHPGVPFISVDIEDVGAGIDDGAVGISLRGAWLTPSSPAVSWDGRTITYDGSLRVPVDTIWAGDTVQICVQAGDLTTLCGPNTMLDCWNYITTSNGPYAEPRFPENGAVVSCTDTTIRIFVHDSDDDPIRPPSFFTTINDTLEIRGTAWPVVEYSVADTTLIIRYRSVVDEDTFFRHGDTITVAIDSVTDIWRAPLTEPFFLWFVLDFEGPEIVAGSPSLGSARPPGAPDMWFYCEDFPAGLDRTRGEISIGGFTYGVGSGALWRGDTLTLSGAAYSPDTAFIDGDSVIVEITLYDKAQHCGANVSVIEWWFKVQTSPPTATILSPHDGAITSCDGGNIAILFSDVEGLNYDSCGVVIDGIPRYRSHPSLFFIGDTLYYNNSGEFAHGDVVSFWPIAKDIYGTELLEADTFTFTVDIRPPEADNHLPAPDAGIYDWTSPVSLELTDDIAGVDESSLSMQITTPRWTRTFTPDSFAVNWDGVVFSLDVPTFNGGAEWSPGVDDSLIFWHERDTVRIEVFASDNVCCCGANEATFAWSFHIIDDDTLPPEFSDISPDTFWSGIAEFVTAVITDPSGIYEPSVQLVWSAVGDFSDETIVPMARFVGDTFITTEPIGPFFAGDVPAFVISAYDDDFDFENPLDRTRGVSYTMNPLLIIGQGPVAELLHPDDGAFSSCAAGDIIIRIADEQGVDASSIRLAVNEDTFAVGGQMIYSSDTLIFQPPSAFPDGATVTVRLISATDALGYPLDSMDTWRYYIDTSPPEIAPTSWTHTLDPNADATVVWRIRDYGAGIDNASIAITIDGDSLDIYSHGIAFDGEFLSFDPEAMGYSLDSAVTICLTACDLAQYCGANCTEAVCIEIRRTKTTPCEVWPIPFTPNDDGANDIVWFEYPDMEFSPATIEIFTIEGRRVFSRDFPPSAPESGTFWDGVADDGRRALPGTYVYIITKNGEVVCKGTLVLVR
ncbi:MAG TPA: hypothetical protein ENN07_02245 [candidate division Zixibacteria bacterium]|nr:hypothetical protein [candidate division Zixibacteria bacterium]